MPDFFVTDAPRFHPTECVFCAASTDPEGFIDGGVELVPHGHLYVCASCAKQAGARFGMVAASEAHQLEDVLAGLVAENDQLHARLAEEQDRVVVSRADLRAIVAERAAKK